MIHIKEGFDAKIRDLTNQVYVSSNRLWNDLKSDKTFITEVFNSYNRKHENSLSDLASFIRKFESKEIVYVLGFTSNIKGKSVIRDVNHHKSNIAKFSLIQCFREQVDNYDIMICEIEKEYS